jgi:hypothetical protein
VALTKKESKLDEDIGRLLSMSNTTQVFLMELLREKLYLFEFIG